MPNSNHFIFWFIKQLWAPPQQFQTEPFITADKDNSLVIRQSCTDSSVLLSSSEPGCKRPATLRLNWQLERGRQVSRNWIHQESVTDTVFKKFFPCVIKLTDVSSNTLLHRCFFGYFVRTLYEFVTERLKYQQNYVRVVNLLYLICHGRRHKDSRASVLMSNLNAAGVPRFLCQTWYITSKSSLK